MASIRITGESQVIANLRALQFKLRERAIDKAAKAGAEIARSAIQQNAPTDPDRSKLSKYIDKEHTKLRHPPIKDNIIIYKRRRSWDEKGESIAYLVGPNKLGGFHGYFIEHGIAGKEKISIREFVDRSFKQCRERIRQAVIESLTNAVNK